MAAKNGRHGTRPDAAKKMGAMAGVVSRHAEVLCFWGEHGAEWRPS